MKILRFFAICLSLVVFLTACSTAPPDKRGKIYCPACGTEFDALFEKRF